MFGFPSLCAQPSPKAVSECPTSCMVNDAAISANALTHVDGVFSFVADAVSLKILQSGDRVSQIGSINWSSAVTFCEHAIQKINVAFKILLFIKRYFSYVAPCFSKNWI